MRSSLLPREIRARFSRTLLLFPLPFTFVLVLLSCAGDSTGPPQANHPPSVRIIAGAANGDSAGVDYRVRFQWTGFDDDGVISEYRWAVDELGDAAVWHVLSESSVSLHFQATTPSPDGDFFTDWHTFAVQATDNEGARSEIATQTFNARTLAPTTRFTFPDLTHQDAPTLGRRPILEWTGEDLDASDPDRKPLAYEVKLVRVPEVVAPDRVLLDSLSSSTNLLIDPVEIDRVAWKRIEGDLTSLRLPELDPADRLAFGIRALDEAGAREPHMIRGTNFFAFYVLPSPGRPIVVVRERSHGSFVFPTDGPIWEIEAATDAPLYFQWTGDASGYGTRPGYSNFALDIPDVEDDTLRDPRGIGGWIGWGSWQGTVAPIVFPASEAGTTHHLWIKVRDLDDLPDSERLCHVAIDLVGFRFDRHALIIDDSRIPGIPDTEHDAFLHTTVLRRLFELGDVDFYATEDRPVLDLATLGRYRQVVWQTSDGVPRRPTDPIADLRRDLATYSTAGGRLFLLGDRLSCALDPPEIGNCTFPRIAPGASNESPDFQRDGFLWQFMKYRGDLVTSLSGTTPSAEASGMVGARSLDPSYPDLSIDRAKWDPRGTIDGDRRFRGGAKHWEGVLGRGAIERMAGLDSLYEVSTFDTTLCCGRVEHGLAHAIVAQRYRSTPADSAAGAAQGRIAMFDFQPWWLEPTTLSQAGDAVIDWLVTGSDR